MFSSCNIRLFSAFTNIHQTKTVRRHRFRHCAKKQFISEDADLGDPVSRELLGSIAFVAEFTTFKLKRPLP